MPTPIIYNGFKYRMACGESNLFSPQGPHGEFVQLYLWGGLFDKDLVYTPDKDLLSDEGGLYFDMGAGVKKYEMSDIHAYVNGVTLESYLNTIKMVGEDLVFPNVTLVDIRFVALWFGIFNGFIGIWDIGTNQSVSGADFTVHWASDGILKIV